MRKRRLFIASALVGAVITWITLSQSTPPEPHSHIETISMSWKHYPESGGVMDITVRRAEYPSFVEYQEAVLWHEEMWPPGDPPTQGGG